MLADYDRVVVTYRHGDGTVYVLRPPGQDPAAILRVARLVLPEGPYRDLAGLGMPASGPSSSPTTTGWSSPAAPVTAPSACYAPPDTTRPRS